MRQMAYLLFIYNKTDKRNQRFQDFSQNSRIYKTQLQFVNFFFGHPLDTIYFYGSRISKHNSEIFGKDVIPLLHRYLPHTDNLTCKSLNLFLSPFLLIFDLASFFREKEYTD